MYDEKNVCYKKMYYKNCIFISTNIKLKQYFENNTWHNCATTKKYSKHPLHKTVNAPCRDQ